ncbi:uncharacterized protein LY89DRAFT_167493 [Mollisia scopiformis]|uniref:Uncharacterized protein n=1 Tax=Mollisia scopiformis TaxID=149040 RepID=A0A194XSU3_MOLSC|nr:uncharacterized protein LY89DRAFT_167493 [Mollisia scopiformis]KUJ23109.1 hypothetical protein LY89DRAFT_167493 [Mollisia scopiformis]
MPILRPLPSLLSRSVQQGLLACLREPTPTSLSLSSLAPHTNLYLNTSKIATNSDLYVQQSISLSCLLLAAVQFIHPASQPAFPLAMMGQQPAASQPASQHFPIPKQHSTPNLVPSLTTREPSMHMQPV